jgi:serine/threonine-protein kinase
VWSFGAIAFRLLTGRDVHPARTPNAQVLLAASYPAPALAPLAPRVPAALTAVIDRALSFDPAARFEDAGAMHAAWLNSLA